MSISNIEYVVIPKDYKKSYQLLTKSYEREIQMKPLYDETWKKLEALALTDEEGLIQAIELGDTLDPRYVASLFALLMNSQAKKEDFSYELYNWTHETRGGEYFEHLWEVIMSIEGFYKFGGWFYKGKSIDSGDVYDIALKHYGLEDGITKVHGINSRLLKPFLIGMEGEIHRGTGSTRCYVSNVVSPDGVVDVQVHLRSVDKIDVSNALTYTDADHEGIQRGILYCHIFFRSMNEGKYTLKENQKPLLQAIGHLSFVKENGQPVPLDQEASVEIEIEFPKAMVTELKASW